MTKGKNPGWKGIRYYGMKEYVIIIKFRVNFLSFTSFSSFCSDRVLYFPVLEGKRAVRRQINLHSTP